MVWTSAVADRRAVRHQQEAYQALAVVVLLHTSGEVDRQAYQEQAVARTMGVEVVHLGDLQVEQQEVRSKEVHQLRAASKLQGAAALCVPAPDGHRQAGNKISQWRIEEVVRSSLVPETGEVEVDHRTKLEVQPVLEEADQSSEVVNGSHFYDDCHFDH